MHSSSWKTEALCDWKERFWKVIEQMYFFPSLLQCIPWGLAKWQKATYFIVHQQFFACAALQEWKYSFVSQGVSSAHRVIKPFFKPTKMEYFNQRTFLGDEARCWLEKAHSAIKMVPPIYNLKYLEWYHRRLRAAVKERWYFLIKASFRIWATLPVFA